MDDLDEIRDVTNGGITASFVGIRYVFTTTADGSEIPFPTTWDVSKTRRK